MNHRKVKQVKMRKSSFDRTKQLKLERRSDVCLSREMVNQNKMIQKIIKKLDLLERRLKGDFIMTKDMKNENKFKLYKTRKNCKIELYDVGDSFAVEVIEYKDGFIAWLHHANSWFSMAIVSSPKKEFLGTKLEFEVDHDLFLEIVQRGLLSRIECFRKHCPIAEF